MDDEVYIVVVETSGYFGALTVIDRPYAAKAAQQLRSGGRRVRQMTREEYIAAMDQQTEERRRNIRYTDEAFS